MEPLREAHRHSGRRHSLPDMFQGEIALQVSDVLPNGRLCPVLFAQVLLKPCHHHLVVVPQVTLQEGQKGRAALS